MSARAAGGSRDQAPGPLAHVESSFFAVPTPRFSYFSPLAQEAEAVRRAGHSAPGSLRLLVLVCRGRVRESVGFVTPPQDGACLASLYLQRSLLKSCPKSKAFWEFGIANEEGSSWEQFPSTAAADVSWICLFSGIQLTARGFPRARGFPAGLQFIDRSYRCLLEKPNTFHFSHFIVEYLGSLLLPPNELVDVFPR